MADQGWCSFDTATRVGSAPEVAAHANEAHLQHVRSWLDAGYRTQHIDLDAQAVEFARTGSSRA